MNEAKRRFLEADYLPLIRSIDPSAKGLWGKMNVQQMIEHVTGFFKNSSGRLKLPLVTPPENLPKYYAFLMSEKPFRENTKAPVEIIPDEPLPLRYKTPEEAIDRLDTSVQEFFDFFRDDPEKKTLHPVFGDLNFAEWVQLHHKHVIHHLRQFGVTVELPNG